MRELRFGERTFKAEVRMASELKPVLAFPEKLKGDFEAYYMFRDLYRSDEDRRKIHAARLRYDITVIPPAEVGGERIKTFGHYHPAINELSYPEIYQVLEGEAIYLIQKKSKGIEDCIAIFASKGDCVLIPPNYGHVTINPSDETLKMANWVCRDFSSVYDEYRKLRGACYYYVNREWVVNELYLRVYGDIPKLRTAKPVDFLELRGENMYRLINNLSEIDFLVNPVPMPPEKFLKIE